MQSKKQRIFSWLELSLQIVTNTKNETKMIHKLQLFDTQPYFFVLFLTFLTFSPVTAFSRFIDLSC